MRQKAGKCIMKNKLTYNETVCEALAIALIQLMERKDVAQITISEIVKLAGVSRSSFYRNFESKEELLCEYIIGLYHDYFNSEKMREHASGTLDKRSFMLPRFRFIKEHRNIFSALYENDMLYYFFAQTESDLILFLCGQREDLSPYHRSMLSGACAGVVRKWIENGFEETEEEMTDIFIDTPKRK